MPTFVVPEGPTTIVGDVQPAARLQLPPGTLLNGRYEVQALLGEGGMGAVYAAHDRDAGRDVALKMIAATAAHHESLLLFKSEFKTMTALAHPNIAAVYDFEPVWNSADHLFTLELVAGRDLMRATEG